MIINYLAKISKKELKDLNHFIDYYYFDKIYILNNDLIKYLEEHTNLEFDEIFEKSLIYELSLNNKSNKSYNLEVEFENI